MWDGFVRRTAAAVSVSLLAACGGGGGSGGESDGGTPPAEYVLTVTRGGLGGITSTPAGIDCGTRCQASYAAGAVVTLLAEPAQGQQFDGWSASGCSGTGACSLTMRQATSVAATFSATPVNERALNVSVLGPGSVTSTPSGIACGEACSRSYPQGTSVSLVATAQEGAVFTGWSGGGCSGAGACTVLMSATTSVTASFEPVTHLLTVVRVGDGSVASSPPGISCGSDCSESFPQGRVVGLSASPAANATFVGWSGGGCSGTGNCSVAMNAARTVTATFSTATAVGLSARPDNRSCFAFDPPTDSTASLALQPAFASLPAFASPVAMLQAPNDSARWFVVEKSGVVRSFANSGAVASSTVFADVTPLIRTAGEEEAGLLGMAFDPNFGTGTGQNRYVYLFYSGAPTSGYRLRSTVARFTANAALTALDLSTQVTLIGLDKLESNHNGGHLAFGPDGYLYVGFGDGGGAPNPQAQDDRFLFGKMIRIDVAGTTGSVPYAIPPDNPNAGGSMCHATGRGATGCAEVWARGLRNPWRWSFDRASGRLWVGDVGWGSFEEVNVVTRNANYGWPITEGAACVTAGCNRSGLTDPVHAVARGDGQSITGGYVYRGTQATDLLGQYLFGDFGSRMFGAVIAGSTPGSYSARTLIAPFSSSSVMVSSFGQAHDGELYVLDYSAGRISRLVFSTGSGAGGPSVPNLLSATGCVSDTDPRQPAPGVLAYEVNAPFWSDGAAKERFLALPSSTAAFSIGTDGGWTTPPGAVLMKSFRLGGALVETRLLMRQSNGDWAGYSYEWNVAQSDATLVSASGKDKVIGGQAWWYPSRSQCMQCHTVAAGFALGLETQQLNRAATYSQTGMTAHQLLTLSAPHVALLTPLVTDPASLPKLADPFGGESLASRARAYLHTNCAMCHRPGGPTPVSLNLLASASLSATNACNQVPTRGTMGLPNARIVAPGAPDSSVLVSRMTSRDAAFQMPPIGSHVADAAGIALMRQWISTLSTCN